MKNQTLLLLLGAVGVGAVVLLATRKASANPSPAPVIPSPGMSPACAAQLTVLQGMLVGMKPHLDACIVNPNSGNAECQDVVKSLAPVLQAFKATCGDLPGIPGVPGIPSIPGVPQPPVIGTPVNPFAPVVAAQVNPFAPVVVAPVVAPSIAPTLPPVATKPATSGYRMM